MERYVTGAAIKELREGRKLTQRALADLLSVSDKTISKWETGRGLPDISLIGQLAGALGVSVAELLSGSLVINKNRASNMLRGHFYSCPICGNIIYAAGAGSFSCCGVTLPPLEAEEPDEGHAVAVREIEYDYYVTVRHPMTREHHISFFACVASSRADILKLYPEQECEGRFPQSGGGVIYACCNRHGLFKVKV